MCARPDPDDELVADHLARIAHLLAPMVARYSFGAIADTPEGRDLLGAAPDLRRSLAIATLAGPRSGRTAAIVAEVPWSDQWPADLGRALVRRKIVWEPESAALALRLVAATDFDDERIQLVLKAADQIAETHPGHPRVMEGLDRLDAMVRTTATHRYRVPEMRARVAAAIARHTPVDLLDLSPISLDDPWGVAARTVLAAADDRGVDVGRLVRSLSDAPAASKPTDRWLRDMAEVVADARCRDVVRTLVRLLVDLEAVDRGLLGVGNAAVARAAVWALGRGSVTGADVELLAAVVARCSGSTHPTFGAAPAQARRVAGAAIATLRVIEERSTPEGAAADRALHAAWEIADRGDVLRSIGRALGFSEPQIAARIARARRRKLARTSGSGGPPPAE